MKLSIDISGIQIKQRLFVFDPDEDQVYLDGFLCYPQARRDCPNFLDIYLPPDYVEWLPEQ